MTIDELRKDSFFQQLTKGQQSFVVERCAGKDDIEAAKASWVCSTNDSAKAQARRALTNPGVKLLLGKFFNIGPNRCVPLREDLIGVLWQRIQKNSADDGDITDMVKVIAELAGYKTKPAEPVTPPPPSDGNEEFAL